MVELNSSNAQVGVENRTLVSRYGNSSKFITISFLIFFGIIFQTLIEYNNTETLLLSSFILVFFIIVFMVSDSLLDLKGDFFFNALDAFAFSYKLRSSKVNKMRSAGFYNVFSLSNKLNKFISALNFYKKFNLSRINLLDEEVAIFHNFFFFDFHRTMTNNTHWWKRWGVFEAKYIKYELYKTTFDE